MAEKYLLADLASRHPLPPRLPQGGEDFIGVFVAGGGAEYPAGGLLAVTPYGHGGVMVLGLDDCAAIEQCVEGAEAHDLGLGAPGDRAEQAGAALGEDGVDAAPEAARGFVALQLAGGAGEVEGGPQA